MKKNLKKLTLNRETVLSLSEPGLRLAGGQRQANAGVAMLETRHEDTYCPCTAAGTCM